MINLTINIQASATINIQGTSAVLVRWFQNGSLHREDGPAFTDYRFHMRNKEWVYGKYNQWVVFGSFRSGTISFMSKGI
jgi:hypothetical protein